MASTVCSKIPETIRNGNGRHHVDIITEGQPKVLDTTDQIPKLPLASWKGQGARVEKCREHFQNKFQSSPTFYVRVPGRVNLIGEHIDYCGYGVFPMAIEHDVLILGRAQVSTKAVLRLTNVEDQFEDFECSVDEIRSILRNREQGVAPSWYLYYLCGVLGTLEHMANAEGDVYLTEICVDGRVPPRAGLSSSSALVCAAALATLVAYEGTLGRKEMATICAKSERYIGTEGGGMDQAIAFMATAGTAQLIEFVPKLNGEKVVLPENAVFVIANSRAEANKAASSCYNVRVAECRSAAWIIAKLEGLPNFSEIVKLKTLQQELGLSLKEMSELVSKHLHEEPYAVDEIAQILGMDVNELKSMPLMAKINVAEVPLKLHQRAKHVFEGKAFVNSFASLTRITRTVFLEHPVKVSLLLLRLTEAERVYEFKKICELNTGEAGASNKLVELGKLMSASHSSLRDLYECSHPRLDELIGLSKPFTYGIRLTGAGWGGCVVALLDGERVQEYLQFLEKEYYEKNFGLSSFQSSVFVTQPGTGATILLG
ncbi:N-acetylgalactosamine kinase [Orchesella cincta]|uniref:N-acetylgalactosamine kinase n=1 Tax=Orchesella cincta TaxID=48709 RepID=A0A1D2NMW8_ORCCI|nr:N-acetylgalactosamine kinase [Orchesella cincta]